MTPEGRLLAKVKKLLLRLEVLFLRWHFGPGVARGWPDLCIFIPGGRPLILELKRPGEVPTELQQYRIDRLVEEGYDVHAVDNFDKASEAIMAALGSSALYGARCLASGR